MRVFSLSLIALIYNWWNIFTRLARPDQHMEAVTSRPQLLHAVGSWSLAIFVVDVPAQRADLY